jgi:polyphosphate kinase
LPARSIAKINSLADRETIEALYRASAAGVKIDLLVRGICSLRPGMRGVSENITVRSVVDRFLEHSRVYYFENACQPQVFVASADWLPRNFYRRVETAFPIEDGVLRERIIREVLDISLADNVKARFLRPDGSYERAKPARKEKASRSQFDFMALAEAVTETARQRVDGHTRYPQVKLAPSPFAVLKRKAQ